MRYRELNIVVAIVRVRGVEKNDGGGGDDGGCPSAGKSKTQQNHPERARSDCL